MSRDLPDNPLISVVLPVYNREHYVADAIQSILAQTYAPLEVIVVVDEGSTDGSARIVREFAARDARIRPFFLSHGSQWRARNAGVALAKGEYIAHMDDDDVALPDRLAAQLDWMRRTDVEICGGNIKKFGAENGLMWFPETHRAICHELLFRIALFLPTALIRADIARAHPYDESLIYSDYAMLTQIAHRYRLGNLPQIVLKSRYHSQQIHVIHRHAFQDEQRRYSRLYFQTLFPDATPDDVRSCMHVTDGEPLTCLADLERAGTWLVRLAQTPDRFLRRQMANRWYAACRRSAHLGLACHRIYRQIAPQFELALDRRADPKLWLVCALRLRAGSRLEAWLKRIWHAVRRP